MAFRKFLETANQYEIDKLFEDQASIILAKQKLDKIESFNGSFEFLNMDYPVKVYFEGKYYKTIFHAFQAARTPLNHLREKIVYADNFQEVFSIASTFQDPADWGKQRLRVMEQLNRDKFRRYPDLRNKLKDTGKKELINTYSESTPSNLFWGVVKGKGQNKLGMILEAIREDINSDSELEKWLFCTFNVIEEKNCIPRVHVDIFRNDSRMESRSLSNKSFFLMGQASKCDIQMLHESISRIHGIIFFDENYGVTFIDVGSTAGTCFNGSKLQVHHPQTIKTDDWLNFGASSRTYTFKVDCSGVEEYIEKKKKKLEKMLEALEKTDAPKTNENSAGVKTEVSQETRGSGRSSNGNHNGENGRNRNQTNEKRHGHASRSRSKEKRSHH
jgi:predicted NAD-dependent protein-ADP-ribosyltransferase YbiA (DUF1768 family)/pSer/pThr/pTyr-binding forkhead associated (FHA) protein